MKTKEYNINFKPIASQPKEALVLIFDLEGFSRFFSQPDANLYVPKFINRIFDAMSIIIKGGKHYWTIPGGDDTIAGFSNPVHTKYMGDGALYIWILEDVTRDDVVYFINRLWNLKSFFKNVISRCSEDVPVVDLPSRIRFGLAAGSIYELTYENSKKKEYVGYCINLASRLQGYCRELGFIASARINFPEKELDKHGYIKVVAKKLSGFPKEIVVVDKNEFDRLEETLKKDLFEQL